jgi:hypothetical protein
MGNSVNGDSLRSAGGKRSCFTGFSFFDRIIKIGTIKF